MMPVCSLAINLPLQMPPENLVLGKSRSLCRLSSDPNSLAKMFSWMAKADFGPTWWKKVSQTVANIPNNMAWSISIGHAPWTPWTE